MPRIRSQIEDFEVEEVALYPPSGEGEHTFLWVEKQGVDTEAVVRGLTGALSLERLAVGYAGRKDRWAVTRQWISVPRIAPEAARALAGPGWRVLDAIRHAHKLRTGDLAANRFRVRVRELEPRAAPLASERLAQIARRGMPNRFGRQRFGRAGDNAAAGAAILRGERYRGDRRHARFLVSAFQSALFNEVLDRRPVPPWQLLDGDVAVVHRSGGLFLVGAAAAEAARADALEISPTGPIYGAKMRGAGGAVAELEEAVWREHAQGHWRDVSPPRGLRVDGARRALRVPIGAASAEAHADGSLELCFELPAGSYATVLIEELFPGERIDEGAAGAAAGELGAEGAPGSAGVDDPRSGGSPGAGEDDAP